MVSLEPVDINGTDIPLSQIAAGNYDSYLHKSRRRRQGLGQPPDRPLRLRDEPLAGRGYSLGRRPRRLRRQQRRRLRRRLAPRRLDLPRRRRHQRRVRLGAERRRRRQSPSPSTSRATNGSTTSVSTATTGARPSPRPGTAGSASATLRLLLRDDDPAQRQAGDASPRPPRARPAATRRPGSGGLPRTNPAEFPRVTRRDLVQPSQKESDWRVDSSQASLDAYREVVACSLYGGPGPVQAGVEEPTPAIEAIQGGPSGHGSPSGRPAVARVARHGTISYRLSQPAKVEIGSQQRGHAKRQRHPSSSRSCRAAAGGSASRPSRRASGSTPGGYRVWPGRLARRQAVARRGGSGSGFLVCPRSAQAPLPRCRPRRLGAATPGRARRPLGIPGSASQGHGSRRGPSPRPRCRSPASQPIATPVRLRD